MSEATEAKAFEAVSKHARFADLVTVTRCVAQQAAAARKLQWIALTDCVPEADRGTLTEEDAKTDFGNAWSALERGPKTADERALVRALWAHALAESRTLTATEEDDLVARVLWLAAFTPFDATLLLDRALGDGADTFWPVLGERLRRLDAGELDTPGRAEVLAGAVALLSSSSSSAAKERSRLATHLKDPAVVALLTPSNAPPAARSSAPELRGELVPAPRNPAMTLALAVTGLLFVSALARLTAKVALGYRRPADITLTADSVRIHSRTLVLGRSVRERDVVLARPGLARAIREVRYPSAAFYAGLFFLAVGSLFGVRTFLDGVRAASPSLLFYGVAIVAIGVGVDFALATLGKSGPGTCGVVFVNRDGTALSVAGVDAADADRALAELTVASPSK